MPEPAQPPVRPWPRPLSVVLLGAFVLVDGAFWIVGFWELFSGLGKLPAAGTHLFYALVLMLVGGWAWRWAVAAGKVGGRPTARFGGA